MDACAFSLVASVFYVEKHFLSLKITILMGSCLFDSLLNASFSLFFPFFSSSVEASLSVEGTGSFFHSCAGEARTFLITERSFSVIFIKVMISSVLRVIDLPFFKSKPPPFLKHLLTSDKCMRFPTMWYVRPAKTQTSLCISAV